MTINNATVEQINVALLDLDKRIKALNIDNEAIKSLQNSIKAIKSSLNGTKAGLKSGETYDINISGNASTATNANHAETATVAETATNANHAETAGTAETATNATNAETALKANEADHANVPTGFEKIVSQDTWGNQDGVFITDWQTVQKKDLYDAGNISFRFNEGQLNIIIDGVFYQNEGNYKLVDENSIKSIMKPNYTTGKIPAGVYTSGQTASVSASITTTRGNPVFISYSGDFNSVDSGSTTPWICFKLYVDGQLVQTTAVDYSVTVVSDNTAFAGNALAVLSAGSHTIRLDAELRGVASGQIQFQEQDNIVNLVAFEL